MRQCIWRELRKRTCTDPTTKNNAGNAKIVLAIRWHCQHSPFNTSHHPAMKYPRFPHLCRVAAASGVFPPKVLATPVSRNHQRHAVQIWFRTLKDSPCDPATCASLAVSRAFLTRTPKAFRDDLIKSTPVEFYARQLRDLPEFQKARNYPANFAPSPAGMPHGSSIPPLSFRRILNLPPLRKIQRQRDKGTLERLNRECARVATFEQYGHPACRMAIAYPLPGKSFESFRRAANAAGAYPAGGFPQNYVFSLTDVFDPRA